MSEPILHIRERLARGGISKAEARRWTRILEWRIYDCLRFYPWPALIASLQADLVALRRYL